MDKVALITGSSRGIGADVARRLAADGFRVVINHSGSPEPAETVAAQVRAAGGAAIVVRADIADPVAVAALFDAAQDAFGGVDVVVNAAGILKLAPLAECDDALFGQSLDVNLRGTFNVLRLAAQRVREGGRMITFSSSVIALRLPGYGVYAATKAAVEAMTQVLAQELRGRRITVNAVAPGPVATDLFLAGKSPEVIERMARMNPLERLGETGDIAGVVAFLAGPDGAWVNGQVLRANGGMV